MIPTQVIPSGWKRGEPLIWIGRGPRYVAMIKWPTRQFEGLDPKRWSEVVDAVRMGPRVKSDG